MKYKDLNTEQYPKLLEDAIKKLTVTLDRDSKVLTEMNNSLNWIVTLLCVVLVAGINYFKNAASSEFENDLLYGSLICFCIAVVILIIHKIFLVRYEKVKLKYLNMLNTHELELKYDIKLLKKNILEEDNFFIVDFINNFRNGKYLPSPESDERSAEFPKLDKKITGGARIIKFTFWLSIMLFVLDTSAIFYLILS